MTENHNPRWTFSYAWSCWYLHGAPAIAYLLSDTQTKYYSSFRFVELM